MTARVYEHPAVAARRERASSTVSGSPRIVPLLMFTLLVVAVFFAMIYLRIALDRSAFELETINDQIAVETSRQYDLRLELARLQDPSTIAAQAEAIGLVFPNERRTLSVEGIDDITEPLPDATTALALDQARP